MEPWARAARVLLAYARCIMHYARAELAYRRLEEEGVGVGEAVRELERTHPEEAGRAARLLLEIGERYERAASTPFHPIDEEELRALARAARELAELARGLLLGEGGGQ